MCVFVCVKMSVFGVDSSQFYSRATQCFSRETNCYFLPISLLSKVQSVSLLHICYTHTSLPPSLSLSLSLSLPLPLSTGGHRTPLKRLPMLGGRELNIYHLYQEVQKRGGSEKVYKYNTTIHTYMFYVVHNVCMYYTCLCTCWYNYGST